MRMFRKAAVGVAGLALAAGGLVTVTSVGADAAAPCASENQAAGAARNEVAHKAFAYNKTKKRLKKARRADRKHHTRATRKKVRQARRARNSARARYEAALTRYRTASATASRCEASSSPSRPATSGDVVDSVTKALLALGVPPQGVDQLRPALGPLGDAIAGTPLGQLPPVVDQVASALAGGYDPSLLVGLIGQITGPLTQAGLPADTIAQAVAQGLAQLPSDPSQLPSDPAGLIDLVIGGVEKALAGTPLDQLDAVLEQLRTGLDGLLGALGGGAPSLPGLPL